MERLEGMLGFFRNESAIFSKSGKGNQQEPLSDHLRTGGQKKFAFLYRHNLRQLDGRQTSGHHRHQKNGQGRFPQSTQKAHSRILPPQQGLVSRGPRHRRHDEKKHPAPYLPGSSPRIDRTFLPQDRQIKYAQKSFGKFPRFSHSSLPGLHITVFFC